MNKHKANHSAYEHAFADSIRDGTITRDELRELAKEEDQFSAALKLLVAPFQPVRQLVGGSSPKIKAIIAEKTTDAHDGFGIDYAQATGTTIDRNRIEGGERAGINGQYFRLSDDGTQMQPFEIDHHNTLITAFPEGKEKDWPTVVLCTNSNLVSPQSFFDSFQAATKIIPKVTSVKPAQLIVAGNYATERNFGANMEAVVKRANTLNYGRSVVENHPPMPAAFNQAALLESILVKRGDDGSIVTAETQHHQKRPVLRSDAADILQHVTTFGYSGGHFNNKDAFRILRDKIADGQFAVETDNGYRQSLPDDAAMLKNVRMVGLAGSAARQDIVETNMPKEVNFLSREDGLLESNGQFLTRGRNDLYIKNPHPDRGPIDPDFKGHGQDALVEALLHPANRWTIGEAAGKLTESVKERSL